MYHCTYCTYTDTKGEGNPGLYEGCRSTTSFMHQKTFSLSLSKNFPSNRIFFRPFSYSDGRNFPTIPEFFRSYSHSLGRTLQSYTQESFIFYRDIFVKSINNKSFLERICLPLKQKQILKKMIKEISNKVLKNIL